MFCNKIPLRAGQCLLLCCLLAGTLSCSRDITDSDLRFAQARQTSAHERLVAMDTEVKALSEEVKKLKEYGGPGHAEWLKKMDELKDEKIKLEAIKTEVDAKVAKFAAAAKVHREALAKGIP